MDIQVNKIRKGLERHKPLDESKLGFGLTMTNHMFMMDYNAEKQWHNPRVEPYGPLHLYPEAVILHIAQGAFEGLKAYRGQSDEIYLFRAKDNLKRLLKTCDRMCIPLFPEEYAYEGLKKLIEIDKEWIPSSPGTSLYFRPNVIATENFVGVRPATEFLFYIIASPVGAYLAEGLAPIKIMVEDKYTRAALGGTGDVKTPANYGPTLKAQIKAIEKGFDQVLWMDSKEHAYVEEVGATNIFFKLKNELVTPALNGSILPGITRDSVITMAKDMGLNMQERKISIKEVISGIETGDLEEVFCTGTAAILSPVSLLHLQNRDYQVGNGKDYPISQTLYKALTGIQYGTVEDPYGWRIKVH